MKKSVILFLLISCFSFAQVKKEVLFTIDNQPFYSDDFVRVYNKNLDLVKDDSQKDLDNYLKLYIGYKLKVEKAKKEGLEESVAYKKELSSYRNQLAKKYVNDVKVTQQLVEEAYARMKEEIRASHILVRVPEGAVPKDTLKAYNVITNIKKRLASGEDFETLAVQFSEDPSVKENKGDLGYFTAFKMVYPFENGAYTTKVGEVSDVVRSRFGYHLIKVTDKRKNRGKVEVAHIMLLTPKTATTEEKTQIEQQINAIYKKIQQGEKFETLAKQFSEDKSTAQKGGKLQAFSSGQLTSKSFENEAFSLQKEGDISKPFVSKFGWHIVKLINKKPIALLKELQPSLEKQIKRDSRSLLITNSLTNKLKQKYTINKNDKVYNNTIKLITNAIYDKKWQKPDNYTLKNETLVTINNDKKLLVDGFLAYVQSQQKVDVSARPIKALLHKFYNQWLGSELITYYNANLENEFPEFRYIMEEYRDGLLLFDLMEKEIWNKAKNDTIGQENFYNKNRENYQWKRRYDADLLSSTNKKVIEKARKYLKKKKDIAFIKNKLNKKGKVAIIEKTGIFTADESIFSLLNIQKIGVSKVVENNAYYFVANVKEILPTKPKTITECKGKLISDYQQFLEKNWVNNLKKEFKVTVNKDVFNNVKKQINK